MISKAAPVVCSPAVVPRVHLVDDQRAKRVEQPGSNVCVGWSSDDQPRRSENTPLRRRAITPSWLGAEQLRDHARHARDSGPAPRACLLHPWPPDGDGVGTGARVTRPREARAAPGDQSSCRGCQIPASEPEHTSVLSSRAGELTHCHGRRPLRRNVRASWCRDS